MYRRVCIDTSTWDGMYNPVYPRIREVESKRTRTEIAVNGNVLAHRRPSMTVFSFYVVFIHNKLIGPKYV